MYRIEYTEGVADDLAKLRAFDRSRILDSIEEHLAHGPAEESRNKKVVIGLIPPWEYVEPIWQLRIGEYRVFYDVNEESSVVIVRAIRRKAAHKRTEDIL